MLELTPDRTLGVETWELATMEDLRTAIDKRRRSFESELQEVLDLAS